jgi:hypothetical protein
MDASTPDLHSLAARVETLERQNQILKLLGAGTLILLLAQFGLEIGARRASRLDTIVTTQLVLKDKAGHDGAELSFDKDGQAALHLFGLGDDQGENATLNPKKLELRFNNSSTSFSDGGLFMFDGKGDQIIGLGSPLGAEPFLQLFGSNRSTIRLDATQEIGPAVTITDEQGFSQVLGSASLQTTRTGEQHRTSAASLTLFGKDGKVLWSAP